MSDVETVSTSCPDRVLEAAFEVFCESGYRASIDAVAKRAGVVRQTIYNNFENKEALFLAVLEQAVRDVFATLSAEDDDWYSRLLAFSMQFRAKVLSAQAVNLHRLLIAEAPRFPALAQAFYQRVILFSRQQMAQVIAQAMQDGCLRAEDAMEAAHVYLDLLVSHDHDALLFGNAALDPAQETAKVERAITLFMRAYANPASPLICSTLPKEAS